METILYVVRDHGIEPKIFSGSNTIEDVAECMANYPAFKSKQAAMEHAINCLFDRVLELERKLFLRK